MAQSLKPGTLDRLPDCCRRGGLGLVLLNTEAGSNPGSFGPEGNGWMQTGLPAGQYCDVIPSNLALDNAYGNFYALLAVGTNPLQRLYGRSHAQA
jgi:hypothetical protein